MRQEGIALNAALKTADTEAVCTALEDLVRRAPNVSKLAHEASINRYFIGLSMARKVPDFQ
jgi:DNA-binding phage protein